MSSLILPSRLTRQPQQAAQFAASGLGGRLAASIVPSLGQAVVLNRPIALSSGVSRVATSEGIAFQHSASNGNVAFGLPGGLDTLIPPGQAFSVFLRVFVSTLGARQAVIADHNAGGDLDSIKLEITAANQWLFALNDGTSRTVTVAGVTTGWHDVLLVHTPGTGGAMSVDSLPAGVVSFTAPLRNGVALRLGSFGTYTTLCFRGRTAVCHIFRGDVSAQYQSLRDNPWQVFNAPARSMVVAPASAVLPGESYTLPASQGSYTITGNAAGLRATRRLGTAAGAYSLTGNPARLAIARRLTAAPGAYSLTGNAASLIKGAAPRALEAAAGSYIITGRPAALKTARRLQAQGGSYALTGFATGAPASGPVPRYADFAFIGLSGAQGMAYLGPDRIWRTANLGPDRIQQTAGLL